MEDDLIAKQRHLVGIRAHLRFDLDAHDTLSPLRPRPEEGRREDKLFLGLNASTHSGADLPAGHRVVAPGNHDGCVEGLQQRQASDVTDDEAATIRHMVEGGVQRTCQVVGIGEVLDHRVHQHGVHRLQIEVWQVQRIPMPQRDVSAQITLGDTVTNRIESRGRQVQARTSYARLGQRQKNETAATTDFQHVTRVEPPYQLNRLAPPGPHVVERERPTSEAGTPPREVVFLLGLVGQRVIHDTPPLHSSGGEFGAEILGNF